jgi:hypothetical protein
MYNEENKLRNLSITNPEIFKLRTNTLSMINSRVQSIYNQSIKDESVRVPSIKVPPMRIPPIYTTPIVNPYRIPTVIYSPIVSVILKGGLGNRIFMILAGLGYAEK